MKTIQPKRLRYSKRSVSLATGKIYRFDGYVSIKTLHVNKHGSKKKHKCSPKSLTPYASWEVHTLGGRPSCVTVVVGEDVPKVLRFAKLWKPIGE